LPSAIVTASVEPKAFVAYYRVSTREQQESGLGLSAQRSSVARYVEAVHGRLVQTFEEVESGKTVNRPALMAAVSLCREQGATLVIAKLDRLARNVSFVAQLMDGGVDFVAADMPSANRLTIHLVSAIAEYERELIAERVRVALAAARARGTRLGNPNLDRVRGFATRAAQGKADRYAESMRPVLLEIDATGPLSLPKLCAVLERRGYRTPGGKTRWYPAGAQALRQRIATLGA
jgi:DNA invertase Pin-like site-specific DNA recombinase